VWWAYEFSVSAGKKIGPSHGSVVVFQALPNMKKYGTELGLAIPPLVYLVDTAPGSCRPNITDSEMESLPALGVFFLGPSKVNPQQRFRA